MGLIDSERMHLLMSKRVTLVYQSVSFLKLVSENDKRKRVKSKEYNITSTLLNPFSRKSRNALMVKFYLAEVDLSANLGDAVLHLRDGVHQQIMAAPV